MGKKLRINGKMQEHREDKTIQELKEEAGILDSEHAFYEDDSGDGAMLNDGQTVRDVPEGSTVSSLPDEGRMFG